MHCNIFFLPPWLGCLRTNYTKKINLIAFKRFPLLKTRAAIKRCCIFYSFSCRFKPAGLYFFVNSKCVITTSWKFNSITIDYLICSQNKFDCIFRTQEYLTVINRLRYSSDISTDLCIFIPIHSQREISARLYTLKCLLMLLILIYNVILCTANILNTIILSMDLIIYFKL